MDIIAIINHAMSLSNSIKSDCIKITSLKKQSPLKIVVAFVCCCCVGCCIGLKFENWNEFQGFLAKMIQIARNLKGNLTQIGGKLSVKGHGRWINQLMIHWTSSVANFRPFWIVFAEFNLNIWVVGLNAALPFRNPIWPVCFDSVFIELIYCRLLHFNSIEGGGIERLRIFRLEGKNFNSIGKMSQNRQRIRRKIKQLANCRNSVSNVALLNSNRLPPMSICKTTKQRKIVVKQKKNDMATLSNFLLGIHFSKEKRKKNRPEKSLCRTTIRNKFNENESKQKKRGAPFINAAPPSELDANYSNCHQPPKFRKQNHHVISTATATATAAPTTPSTHRNQHQKSADNLKNQKSRTNQKTSKFKFFPQKNIFCPTSGNRNRWEKRIKRKFRLPAASIIIQIYLPCYSSRSKASGGKSYKISYANELTCSVCCFCLFPFFSG